MLWKSQVSMVKVKQTADRKRVTKKLVKLLEQKKQELFESIRRTI